MRKLLLFIAISFTILNATAQTNPVIGTYTCDVDSMFQHMDKSGISTGILYDRVFPFANLPFFNINPSQPDTIDFSFFIQASSELKRASYTPNHLLPSADYFYDLKKQSASLNNVELSVISYNYHYIDTAALDKGLLYINSIDSMFYDVPNRLFSPYILKQSTFAAPIDSALDYATGSFTFTFNDSNYYRNHNKIINRILINFNDGNGDIIFNTLNNAHSPSYSFDGEKICRIKVEFTDGSNSTNYFALQIRNAGIANRIGNPVPDDEMSFLATRGFVGYDETIAMYAQANIGIYFADQTLGTTKRIKKPIIITDGIDFTQTTKFQDIYTVYLQYQDANDASKALIDEYNLLGYDVILVDFDDVTDKTVLLPGKNLFNQPGADYVERNAMVVVDIIEWVNSELISQSINEKLVVVGPSMGGLVTRYALRWMELNSLDHNCRLWVSFDAPHRGANIPIGSQYTLEFFANYAEDEDAKISLQTMLNTPAAKQFLIHHYAANSIPQAGAPGFRDRFNTEMETLGWPQDPELRRVSLANGTSLGILTHTPEEKSLEVEGKPSRFWGKTLAFIFRQGNQRLLGTESFFTSNSYNSKRVFYGFIYGPFRNEYLSKVASIPSGSCSIDNSPGGIFDTQQQIANQIPSEVTSKGFKIGLKAFNIKPTHSFIPTKSALGMYDYNNWCENFSSRNLVCSNETPFDDYFTPANNEGHVFLNEANVNWIKNQLSTDFQNCVNVCESDIIQGDDVLCNSVSTIYSIPTISNASILWEVSKPNIASPNTPDLPQTTLNKTGNGTITLTATITNACSTIPIIITKTIQVGLPYITQNAGSGSYIPHPDDLEPWEEPPVNLICTGQQISLNVNVERASGVTWSRTFALPTNNTWSQTGNSVNFYLWGNDQQATFKVSASNVCGVAQEFFSFKSIGCGGDPGDPDPCNQFVVSPNPATSNMNIYVPLIPPPCDDPPIVISKSGQTGSSRGITQVKLFDNLGNLKKQQTTAKTTQTALNISGLTPGIYYLEISDGTYKERQKVVVQ